MKGSLKIAALAMCATGLLSGWSTTAPAATPPNQNCQKHIAAATKTHYGAVYNAYNTCLNDSLVGTNCNALTFTNAIILANNTLRGTIRNYCGGENLGTAVGGLASIGMTPANSPCHDSTENPGFLSVRELAQCIARTNLESVSAALLDAYPCKATPVVFGGASGLTIQAMGSIIPLALTGTTNICYHQLSSFNDMLDGSTGKHVVFYKDTKVNPLVIAANLVLCARNQFGPGQVNCAGDPSSTVSPNYYAMADHVLNKVGTVNTPNNVWDSATRVCSSNGGGGAPFDLITDANTCSGLTPSGTLVSPGYGALSIGTSQCLTFSTQTCLEGDSDLTPGASAGDGSNLFYVGAGCNPGSGPGQPSTGHSDGGAGIACNSTIRRSQSGKTCSSGAAAGQPCVANWQCWVNDNDALTVTCGTTTGVAAGDLIVLDTASFDSKDPTAGDCGADGTCCNTDDDALGKAGEPTIIPLTTGLAEAAVIDAGPSSGGIKIARNETCGAPACITKLTGTQTNCAQLQAGSAPGLSVVGAFPQLDAAGYGDAVVTLRLE